MNSFLFSSPAGRPGPLESSRDRANGAVQGAVRHTLRLEGAAVFGAAMFAFYLSGGSWRWFAALFLAPDLAILAYFAGPRIGAVAYNLVHTSSLPLALLILAHAHPTGRALALIWLAHIGFDRMAGYGLKYATGFGDTHLGKRGRAAGSGR